MTAVQVRLLGTFQVVREAPDRLRLVGELDDSTAAQLADALTDLDGQREVILDLTELDFMDAAGAHVLADAAHHLEDHGQLILRSPHRIVRRVLELTGLQRLATIQVETETEKPSRTIIT